MPKRDGLRATTISVTLSSLFSAGSLGVAAIVIARTLGPEGRGVFAASYSLLYLLVIAGSVGVGPGGRRLLALGPPKGVSLAEYVAAARWLVLGQVVVAVAGAALILPVFGSGRSIGERVAFVGCCVATLASLLAREALYGVGKDRLSALILASGCGLTLVGVVAVSAAGHASVAVFLWVYSVAAVVEFAAARVAARHRPLDRRLDPRHGVVRRVFLSGRPVLLLLLAQAVATRGDRLVVGAIAGPEELGQYAVAVSVMELMSMGSFALGQVAFQQVASGEIPEESMVRARQAAVGGTAVCGVVLFLMAPWLIELAFGDRFAASVTPLRILVVAAIPFSSLQIDTQQLIALGHAGVAARLALGVATFMVVGDIFVVRSWGIQGAAWLSVVAYSLFAVQCRLTLTKRWLSRS